MHRIRTLAIVAAFGCLAGTANAQDRCETDLVGNSYSCDFTFSGSPSSITPLTLTFSAPTAPEVLSDFEVRTTVPAITYACSCVGKGKPGKLKSSENSTAFSCVEAQDDAINNEAFSGKVTGHGSKIVKGRYFHNGAGSGGGVFTCVRN